jgi:hypothetical protein
VALTRTRARVGRGRAGAVDCTLRLVGGRPLRSFLAPLSLRPQAFPTCRNRGSVDTGDKGYWQASGGGHAQLQQGPESGHSAHLSRYRLLGTGGSLVAGSGLLAARLVGTPRFFRCLAKCASPPRSGLPGSVRNRAGGFPGTGAYAGHKGVQGVKMRWSCCGEGEACACGSRGPARMCESGWPDGRSGRGAVAVDYRVDASDDPTRTITASAETGGLRLDAIGAGQCTRDAGADPNDCRMTLTLSHIDYPRTTAKVSRRYAAGAGSAAGGG